MCLITFYFEPKQKLVLAANRDEYFVRPAAPLHQWDNGLVAGQDLKEGGTWLGLNPERRLVALTNVRVLGVAPENPPSRGQLVTELLLGEKPLEQALSELLARARVYAPFNIIAGDINQLWYLTNYPEPTLQSIPAGTHALSNAQLNTPWPKAELAKYQLNQWLQKTSDLATLPRLLNTRHTFPDHLLPNTGVPKLLERMLSAQFIHTPSYGTRCSTALMITPQQTQITEITWNEAGNEAGTVVIKL